MFRVTVCLDSVSLCLDPLMTTHPTNLKNTHDLPLKPSFTYRRILTKLYDSFSLHIFVIHFTNYNAQVMIHVHYFFVVIDDT